MFDSHDQTPQFISEKQIKELLYSCAPTVDQTQREFLKAEIARARSGDKISQFKLHRLLKSLREQGKISHYDQEAVEEAFGEIFEKLTN